MWVNLRLAPWLLIAAAPRLSSTFHRDARTSTSLSAHAFLFPAHQGRRKALKLENRRFDDQLQQRREVLKLEIQGFADQLQREAQSPEIGKSTV